MSFRAKPPLGTPLNPYHLIGKHCIGAWLISEKGGLYLFDSSIHKQLGTFNTLANLTWTPRGILTTANTTRIDIAAKQSLIDLPTTYNFTVVFSARATAPAAGRAAIGWGGTDDLLIYPYDNDSGNGPRVFWRDVGGSQININDGNPPLEIIINLLMYQKRVTTIGYMLMVWRLELHQIRELLALLIA